MNSNKFFSFNRFYLLLRNDILLNYKKYLLTIAGAFVFGFVILYMQMPKVENLENKYNEYTDNRYISGFVMCLFALGYFISTAFAELGDKIKTSNYLLVPASNFEKFLSQFIIRVVIGTALLLVIFWVDAHLARTVALSQIEGPNHEPPSANVSNYIAKFHYSAFLVKDQQHGTLNYWRLADGAAMLMSIFSIGAYLFISKLLFKKKGSLKSIVMLIFVFYLVISTMVFFRPNFYTDFNSYIVNNIVRKLQNGYTNTEIFKFTIEYFVPLFLIPFGYFKLKEKQV